MQPIRTLCLPTGLTIVMGVGRPIGPGGSAGVAWPGGWPEAGGEMGAHAAGGAGADGPEQGMGAGGVGGEEVAQILREGAGGGRVRGG